MIGFVATVVGTGLALWVTSLLYKDISFGPDTQVTTILIVGGDLRSRERHDQAAASRSCRCRSTLVTFGLFGLIINGALLLLAGVGSRRTSSWSFTVGGFPPDFSLQTIIAAVVGGVILSIVSTTHRLAPVREDEQVGQPPVRPGGRPTDLRAR